MNKCNFENAIRIKNSVTKSAVA